MFVTGYLEYILDVFGIISFGATLVLLIELAGIIKLEGISEAVNVKIILASILGILSVLAFYLSKKLKEKLKKE